jgi:antitoxin (DNA-binding transcriptional repressor) of toxin-antitoxin stability system
MPETITLEEAQANLAELIARLIPDEEVLITQNEQPIAKLIRQSQELRQPRRPGSAKGKLIILADDDEHLEDFKEYMQ